MIERMDDFFDKRTHGYEAHMKGCIKDFEGYYNGFSDAIHIKRDLKVLLLGGGTGLELDCILKEHTVDQVTIYDLSSEMLTTFSHKFKKKVTIVSKQASYFEICEKEKYDVIIASMTMHHWTYEEKIGLYKTIQSYLKDEGIYLEGDYYVTLDDEKRLLEEKHLLQVDSHIYHIDIPLSKSSQEKCFYEAGFYLYEVTYDNNGKMIYCCKL